ncbi:hypothetical protein FT986_10115 [Mesonia sp. K4-1]|nr:hypothetical protein FT986_10115 [Mesonia sp. K4-1]
MSFRDYYVNDTDDLGNMYIKDTEGLLNPYIGTWVWQSGNDLITIEFEKIDMEYYTDSRISLYRDRIKGKVKYVENGQEVFNSITAGEYLLTISKPMPTNQKISFTFKDPLMSSKYGHVEITLINNNTQIKFYLRNREGPRLILPGETAEDPDFSMPKRTEFILTKQ